VESLAVVFGSLGAVLLLVGVVGGGFEFMSWTMPPVGRIARGVGFGLGGLFLFVSLGLFVMENSPVAANANGSHSPGPPGSTTAVPSAELSVPVAPRTTVSNPPPSPTPSPSSAAPATGYIAAGGYGTYVFQEPNSNSAVLGQLVDGTLVYIFCTARGETVTALVSGQSSDLWNYTAEGGFIPDVLTNTGTNLPTMPDCSS
jgi:hypothetical protein